MGCYFSLVGCSLSKSDFGIKILVLLASKVQGATIKQMLNSHTLKELL